MKEKIVTVTIRGWWWKRFFYKYQMQQMILERMANQWTEKRGDKLFQAVFDNIVFDKPINLHEFK